MEEVLATQKAVTTMDTASLLKTVYHREFPLPTRPWIMTQIWHELLFAHWPLAPEVLRPLIPLHLEIDTFGGEAWIGVVPFWMSNVHPRGLPNIGALSTFPELNVRTYVKAQGIAGVFFFSLDAGNPIAVALARSIFHLPYFNARMRHQREGDTIDYECHRTHRGVQPADYVARYRPIAPASFSTAGSIEHWLTERYCLYTVFHNHLYRGNIHHRRWPLQVAELETRCDTMALSHGIYLPDAQPLLYYAERLEVLIWALEHCELVSS